ncbi:DUF6211 family protein [Streptomyces alboflavus]|uniref:DUF6211 family protein n=1 Tax=Streptomyces alboflavus TaxID=67267 RepID=UPI000F65882C|nr:DUF6211 family protein [Streptomyces alboflavus]
MVTETAGTTADPNTPQPYDLVQLIPGHPLGVSPDVLLTVADTVDGAPGLVEVHHQHDHPDYWDWSACITAADIAVIIRHTDGTAHRWSSRP